MTEQLSLIYRWVRLEQSAGRKNRILVKYVWVSSRQDLNQLFRIDETWFVEKKPRPRSSQQRAKPTWFLRNVHHATAAEIGGYYPCAECGKPVNWHVNVATICTPDGNYPAVFHPDCVPYKPRIQREYFKLLYMNASHSKVVRDYLESAVSPTRGLKPIEDWTTQDRKESWGRADLGLLPSEDEEVPTLTEAEAIREKWQGESESRESSKHEGKLTREESEVASAIIFEKLTWKQVAEKLNLSQRTVARRVASVETKLGQKLPKDS